MHSCSSNSSLTLCCNTLWTLLFGIISFIFSTRIDEETLIVWCNVISYRYGQMAHSVFHAIIYIQKKIFFLLSSPRSCLLITYILHPAASAPTCTKHISMQFNIAAYNKKWKKSSYNEGNQKLFSVTDYISTNRRVHMQ